MATAAFKDIDTGSTTLTGFAELISPPGGNVTFTAGTRIFEESDKGKDAYLIQKGYVEISRGLGEDKKVLSILGPGEIFGEISVLDGNTRTATATAIHETIVARITHQQIHSAIESEDPLTQLLLHSAIRRLRRSLNKSNDDSYSEQLSMLGRDDYFQKTQKKAVQYINSIAAMKGAIENHKFQLYYQPIINLSSGMIAGYEALIRGPKDMPELFSPASFIPLVEESGMIVELGQWVLSKGIQTLKRFNQEVIKKQLKQPLFISVNVSAKQIETLHNTQALVDIILKSEIDTSQLKLEITESALLTNPELAMTCLTMLRDTGCKIAIDDFGTGYSSLNYLHRFPLDTMKVDRSFINNLSEGENGMRIVAAIINLAKDLKMDVVAEGIEDKKELEWLCKRQCQYGQGYYLDKPMPIQDALRVLTKAYF